MGSWELKHAQGCGVCQPNSRNSRDSLDFSDDGGEVNRAVNSYPYMFVLSPRGRHTTNVCASANYALCPKRSSLKQRASCGTRRQVHDQARLSLFRSLGSVPSYTLKHLLSLSWLYCSCKNHQLRISCPVGVLHIAQLVGSPSASSAIDDSLQNMVSRAQ